MATQGTSPGSASSPAASPPLEATDRILQEIAAVGRRLDTMDARISELTIASSSIRADIAGFRETVHNLDQRLTTMEEHVAVLPVQEAELRSLRAKVTDMEDRSRRENICFFGIPERKEGSDVKTFLKNLLPELTECSIRAYLSLPLLLPDLFLKFMPSHGFVCRGGLLEIILVNMIDFLVSLTVPSDDHLARGSPGFVP
ncbi:hypothetical protein NDU88_003437 [Pleurodeles waltl]|uniref:Uncharacterized protein n=1 Tax=Pleurodeles waltl TaxID=8319 RepID=A0AAV7LIK5_PLEWA|nr:hypothetical protein NDU88_003437 [Pleurodeles waltl]